MGLDYRSRCIVVLPSKGLIKTGGVRFNPNGEESPHQHGTPKQNKEKQQLHQNTTTIPTEENRNQKHTMHASTQSCSINCPNTELSNSKLTHILLPEHSLISNNKMYKRVPKHRPAPPPITIQQPS